MSWPVWKAAEVQPHGHPETLQAPGRATLLSVDLATQPLPTMAMT